MLRFSTAAPPRPKSVQSAISRSIKGVLAPEASLFSTELSTASVEHRLLSKKRHRYWSRVQSWVSACSSSRPYGLSCMDGKCFRKSHSPECPVPIPRLRKLAPNFRGSTRLLIRTSPAVWPNPVSQLFLLYRGRKLKNWMGVEIGTIGTVGTASRAGVSSYVHEPITETKFDVPIAQEPRSEFKFQKMTGRSFCKYP